MEVASSPAPFVWNTFNQPQNHLRRLSFHIACMSKTSEAKPFSKFQTQRPSVLISEVFWRNVFNINNWHGCKCLCIFYIRLSLIHWILSVQPSIRMQVSWPPSEMTALKIINRKVWVHCVNIFRWVKNFVSSLTGWRVNYALRKLLSVNLISLSSWNSKFV